MILTIFIFLVTLVVLVVVHELGHFLIAKKFNIKVLEFGFGIPPRIWGKRIGETLLSLNWLPIGGFVRLLGEDEVSKSVLENERSFAYQKVEKRIATVVAGVVMNLLLSWLIFYIVIASQNFSIFLPTPTLEIIIAKVEGDSPAGQAGLLPGQRILSVNGQKLDDQVLFSDQIKKNAGKSVILGVSDVDGGNLHQINLIPRVNPPANQGALGIATTSVLLKKFSSPIEKILSGPIYSIDLAREIVFGLGGILNDLGTGNFTHASTQVSGPVGIVVASNTLLSSGPAAAIPYLFFVGYLSLSLALINVLPFPGLDGGRLFFLVVEFVTRRKIHPNFEKYTHSIGLALLIGLILLITYSDIRKLILP